MKVKFFLTFLLILLFTHCKTEKVVYAEEDSDKYPNMIQENYSHYIYKSEKRYLEAMIQRANFFEKKKEVVCNVIDAKIYDAKGELSTIIHSDNGLIDKQNKNFIFTNNVVFELIENKTKLYSDEIILDYQNNKLISNSDILIKKEDGSYVKATSMESDIKLETTKFENMEIKYYYEEEDEGEKIENK